MIAMPVTAAVGSALSGYILNLNGWQWLFLLEGLPSAILGLIVYYYLDDAPAKAKWLSVEEKECLAQALAAEHKSDPVSEVAQTKKSILRELATPTVIKYAVAYFC